MPGSLLARYSPVPGRSVPFCCVTRYCSGESFRIASSLLVVDRRRRDGDGLPVEARTRAREEADVIETIGQDAGAEQHRQVGQLREVVGQRVDVDYVLILRPQPEPLADQDGSSLAPTA